MRSSSSTPTARSPEAAVRSTGSIALRVPLDVIKAKRAPYRRHGKPWHRPALQNLDDYDIIQAYGAEYRGIAGYYLLASDVWRLSALRRDAETSMLKTLAAKHKSTVTKIAAKHKAKIETPHGLRTCFEARIERDGKPDLVARFGGIPLVRKKNAVLHDTRAQAGPLPAEGADPPAPEAAMRAVRGSGQGAGAPGPQARQPRGTRPRPARLGGEHGTDAAQDPHGLPHPATTSSTGTLPRTRRRSLESHVR